MSDKMIEKRDWEEFQKVGLLWFVNRLIHLFGWAIVYDIDEDGKIKEVYPARCRFRGFNNNVEDEGFKLLTNHIKNNIDDLIEDL